MADAVRDLYAEIRLDADYTDLMRIDDVFRDLERDLGGLGNRLDRTGDQLRDLGRQGRSGLDDMGDAARRAREELERLGGAGGGGPIPPPGPGGPATASWLDRIKGAASGAFGKLSGLLPGIAGIGAAFATMSAGAVASIAAIGIALVGLGVAAVNAADEVDQHVDLAAAKIGATPEEAAAMAKSGLDLYKKGWGDSFAEIEAGVGVVKGTFRDLTGDELTDVTKKISILGQVADKETSEIASGLKVMLAQYDDLSKGDAIDLLTTGFQKAGPAGEDLLDTVREYAPFFKDAGLSAQDFIGTLVKGMDAGARNTDVVADAFKEMQIQTTDMGSAAAPALEKLGFNAKQVMADMAGGGDKAKQAFNAITAAISYVDDPLEQTNIGVGIFGTKFEDLRATIITAMNNGGEAVAGFKGSTDAAGALIQDNFSTQMRILGQTIKGTFMEAAYNSGIHVMFTQWGADLVAAFPVVLEALNQGMQWFLNVLTDAGVNVDVILQSIYNIFEGVITMIKGLWFLFGPFIVETLGGALALVIQAVQGAMQLIGDIFRTITLLIQGDWEGAWENIKQTGMNLLNNVLQIIENGLNTLWDLFTTTAGRIIEAFTGIDLTQAGKDVISGLMNGVRDMAGKAIEEIKELGGRIADTFKNFFKIHSPSRLMADIAGHIPSGIAVGIEDNTKKAVGAADGMSAAVSSSIEKEMPVYASSSGPITGAGGGMSGSAASTSATVGNVTVNINVERGQDGSAPQEQDIRNAVYEAFQEIFGGLRAGYANGG